MAELKTFKEQTFYEALELVKLNKHSTDDQLKELFKKKLDMTDEIADKYLESVHDFFSRGIF